MRDWLKRRDLTGVSVSANSIIYRYHLLSSKAEKLKQQRHKHASSTDHVFRSRRLEEVEGFLSDQNCLVSLPLDTSFFLISSLNLVLVFITITLLRLSCSMEEDLHLYSMEKRNFQNYLFNILESVTESFENILMFTCCCIYHSR